jgi:hypothetical protein
MGAAVRAALQQASLGKPRRSYDRTGAPAQFRQLQRSAAGRRALALSGVRVTSRTERAWLGGQRQPSRANRAAIGRAYQAMKAGGIPAWVKRGDMTITGVIKTGRDVRNRTLLIQGDRLPPLAWDDIEREWREMTDEELEELVAEDVVTGAIDGVSEPWQFPGPGGYVVTIGG